MFPLVPLIDAHQQENRCRDNTPTPDVHLITGAHNQGLIAGVIASVFVCVVPDNQKSNLGYNNMHASLKLLGYVIVLLMIVAILYSGYTSIKYWPGISV
jgi:hypothetical protein